MRYINNYKAEDMEKNELITLKIDSLTNEGCGVGRCDGIAVFVRGTAPGDTVLARILKVQKTYAYAKVEEIIEPSAHRIDPGCDVFGRCGGCSFQHIDYAAELSAKENFVRDAFERIGGLSIEIEPIISTGRTERYRNKAQIPVAIQDGKPVCGFYSPRSHRVIPCADCRLEPEIFSEITGEIINFVTSRKLSVYDEATHEGCLRHIYLRHGFYSHEVMICLVLSSFDAVYRDLADQLCKKFPDVKSVVVNINPNDTNVILGEREIPLVGSGKIRDTICGIDVELSAKSFYQVNTEAAELVYRKAAEYADLRGSETVLDLYCGAGTIGLSVAKKVKKLIGVEVVPDAVENAKINAKLNGIGNADFICGDAGTVANTLLRNRESPDVIFLDPPRKGCDGATIAAVAAMSPSRVVMISCNPATAARDVKAFADAGFTPVKACPADMFPRTCHVETVVQLINSHHPADIN